MTYTPGPWKLKNAELGPDNDKGIMYIDENENQSLLAEVYEVVNPSGRKADVEANARLIAAAPEMLEALKVSQDTIDNLIHSMQFDGAKVEQVQIQNAKAIAKAEGGAV
jgi:hypothetical protein